MTVWQAVSAEDEIVIIQTESAKELAAKLHVTPHAIYMMWYRERSLLVKRPGRNKKILIEKVVIPDD